MKVPLGTLYSVSRGTFIAGGRAPDAPGTPHGVAGDPMAGRSWSMTDRTLIRRAEAAGIAPRYLDWRGQQVEVSAETLAAILGALYSVPGASAGAGGST